MSRLDKRNKHGLGRKIPNKVKLIVRQHCNFGCVGCGCPIIQYHHFDPPYEDAIEHRAECITLLCTSCHDQVTKGIVSTDVVRHWNQNPKARQHGGPTAWSPAAVIWPCLTFGSDQLWPNSEFNEVGTHFSIREPEREGAPARISLTLSSPDKRAYPWLKIIDNELLIGRNFDARFVGSRLIVKKEKNSQLLEVDFFGGNIVIRRYKVHGKNGAIVVKGNETIYAGPLSTKIIVRERSPIMQVVLRNKQQPSVEPRGALIQITDRGSATFEHCNVNGAGTAIDVVDGEAVVRDCGFNDADTGIKVGENSTVWTKGNQFHNVKRTVRFTKGDDPASSD